MEDVVAISIDTSVIRPICQISKFQIPTPLISFFYVNLEPTRSKISASVVSKFRRSQGLMDLEIWGFAITIVRGPNTWPAHGTNICNHTLTNDFDLDLR